MKKVLTLTFSIIVVGIFYNYLLAQESTTKNNSEMLVQEQKPAFNNDGINSDEEKTSNQQDNQFGENNYAIPSESYIPLEPGYYDEEKYKQSKNINLNLDFQNIRKEVDEDFEHKNEIIDKRRTLLIERIDHEIWKIKFIEKSFEWQFILSLILLCMVIAIVIVGLYFSYIQFTKSFKKDNQDSENQDIKETTIRIGQGEIEISSSVIGLIILTLSLAFFYLYITNIFPFQELGLTKVQQQQTEVKTENKTEDKQ